MNNYCGRIYCAGVTSVPLPDHAENEYPGAGDAVIRTEEPLSNQPDKGNTVPLFAGDADVVTRYCLV